MHFFFLTPENELVHLPDFIVTRSPQTFAQVPTIGKTFVVPNRKQPDLFECTYPASQKPFSQFHVVDERPVIITCIADNINVVAGKQISGYIFREEEIPQKKEALAAIQEAIKKLKETK